MEEQDAPIRSSDTAPAAATSNSSLASSLKTPASAPAISRIGSRSNLVAIPSGHSLGDFRSYEEDGSSYERGGASKIQVQDADTSGHSSRYSKRSGPQRRQKTMRQLQQEVRRRSHLRSDPSSKYFAREGKDECKKTEEKVQDKKGVSKTLADLLFQTAVLGIDTTAKLTRPTLPLLTQVILPLFRDLWEQYTPLRLQTWMKVLPSYLSNVGSLVWDTDSGKSLCDELNKLTDDIIDMASSDVARQCWVDFTVTIIKIIESLHTPEFKSLLDQSAVGMCRFVDVFNSGKAKQVWFDISATLWAMVEVGSDPLVVMTLAEGCAQICFALEEERISLKRRRMKEDAAKRRRTRDRRQMEVYPPNKDAVCGREGVEKALVSTLGMDHMQEQKEKDAPAVHDGPPSVILRNNLLHGDRPGQFENTALGRIDSTGRDDESEITTEIEDLQFKEEANDDIWINLDSRRKQLAYEQGDGDSYPDWANERNQPRDNHDAEPEIYDVFHESILQFHRRLDEVLAATRNESKKIRTPIEKKLFRKENKPNKNVPVVSNDRSNASANRTAFGTDLIHLLVAKRWRIFAIASMCTIATIIMAWFALGCYGGYVLFLGGRNAPNLNSSASPSPPFDASMQQSPSVIIQVVVGQNNKERIIGSRTDSLASISLEEWKQMTFDVEAAIRRQLDSENEL